MTQLPASRLLLHPSTSLEKQPTSMRPWNLILIGFLLSVLGVVLPFLMVIQIVQSTFFLNFFSFIASVTGLILGIIGAALYVRSRRK